MCTMRRGTYAGPGAWEHSGYLAVGHVHAWHLQSSQAHKVMLRKVRGGQGRGGGCPVALGGKRTSPCWRSKLTARCSKLSTSIGLRPPRTLRTAGVKASRTL